MHRLQTQLHSMGVALGLLILVAMSACSGPATEQTGQTGQTGQAAEEPATVTVYEGARLIDGNGQIIESAAFAVENENGKFVSVGAVGEVAASRPILTTSPASRRGLAPLCVASRYPGARPGKLRVVHSLLHLHHFPGPALGSRAVARCRSRFRIKSGKVEYGCCGGQP